MKIKKIAALTLSIAVCALALAGCGGNTPAATTTTPEQTAAPVENAEEKTTTAAPETTAAEEKPEDDTAEEARPVILTVSFGTSYNDSRDITIGGIESAIQAANPDYDVRRAFTSQIIIDKLKERDGLEIDTTRPVMCLMLPEIRANAACRARSVSAGSVSRMNM